MSESNAGHSTEQAESFAYRFALMRSIFDSYIAVFAGDFAGFLFSFSAGLVFCFYRLNVFYSFS